MQLENKSWMIQMITNLYQESRDCKEHHYEKNDAVFILTFVCTYVCTVYTSREGHTIIKELT